MTEETMGYVFDYPTFLRLVAMQDAAIGLLIAVDNGILDASLVSEDGEEIPAWVNTLDEAADKARAVLLPAWSEATR